MSHTVKNLAFLFSHHCDPPPKKKDLRTREQKKKHRLERATKARALRERCNPKA
jgi:hypothetical protein